MKGDLLQVELKTYRRSYHPPNLNVSETLYSFNLLLLLLFFVSRRSLVLFAGLTTVLTCHQEHMKGDLLQVELKTYRRSYHPPNLNVSETLYSFNLLLLLLFFVSRRSRVYISTHARYILDADDHVINLVVLEVAY